MEGRGGSGTYLQVEIVHDPVINIRRIHGPKQMVLTISSFSKSPHMDISSISMSLAGCLSCQRINTNQLTIVSKRQMSPTAIQSTKARNSALNQLM